MAMLAEPRRKQKWTLNPRGKQWSDDSTKFGQKMLEKMGWSSGKGLGANEQGMTEHVKISYKNDQSGIGFKDSGDQWTQHQADFNNFLSQLQEQNSISTEINTEGVESLELKSKQSKARVHYHKFTRGKDVKKYSSKDLANIFGKKDLKDTTEISKPEKVEEVTEEVAGAKDNRGGVLTIKGGNIDEYFKNKLPSFMKGKNSSSRDNRNDSESDECEAKLGFGYSSTKENCDTAVSALAFTNEGLDLGYSESTNDSKKKKVDFAYDNPCLDLQKSKSKVEKSPVDCSNEGFVNPALDLTDLTSNKSNGAEFEISRVELGLDNDALDLSDENSRKKRVTFNEKVEYSTDVCKKKRKGKGKLDKFEVDNSKLKKKLKQSSVANESVSSNEFAGFINEALDVEVFSEEVNDNEMNERKTKKSKRKKNRRASNLETIEEAADEGGSQLGESEIGEAVLLDEGILRKSKKSKKNSNVEANSELSEDTGEIKKKDKRKKYAENKTIDTHQEVVVPEESLDTTKSDKKKQKGKQEEVEITIHTEMSRRKKKRRHKKEKSEDIESANGEQENSDIQIETIDITNVKRKNKKKVKLNAEEEQNGTVVTLNGNDQADITNNSGPAKRKSVDGGNFAKSPKRCKVEKPSATEDAENFVQNRDLSVKSTPPALWDKKGSKSRKIFKSLFAKAPTLLFSGSNINEMPGYGTDFEDIKRCVQEKC
ncbi:G patch domain-containing protein 4 [Diprion similis]|uniref:G patch domain-containing protein 4 n=1 Tax=Diprion similis TaxID=362088 RepID=UPI001EF75EF8|nr:G patch domain-containing protein 4 [Diprion similis]